MSSNSDEVFHSKVGLTILAVAATILYGFFLCKSFGSIDNVIFRIFDCEEETFSFISIVFLGAFYGRYLIMPIFDLSLSFFYMSIKHSEEPEETNSDELFQLALLKYSCWPVLMVAMPILWMCIAVALIVGYTVE